MACGLDSGLDLMGCAALIVFPLVMVDFYVNKLLENWFCLSLRSGRKHKAGGGAKRNPRVGSTSI